MKDTDYFVNILSHFNRENKVFLLIEHIGYMIMKFLKELIFIDLKEQIFKIIDKIIEAIIAMRKTVDILYLNPSGVFVNKKTSRFRSKIFFKTTIFYMWKILK